MTRRRRLPLSECRDCGMPVRFVILPTDRRIPVDPLPNPRGNVAATTIGYHLHGWVVSADHPADGVPLYMPHAASCRDREPRPRPAAETLF